MVLSFDSGCCQLEYYQAGTSKQKRVGGGKSGQSRAGNEEEGGSARRVKSRADTIVTEWFGNSSRGTDAENDRVPERLIRLRNNGDAG